MSTREDAADETKSPAGYGWTPSWLQAVRRRPGRRRALVVAAALLGLGMAWLHWFGLFLAGVLVGLFSRTIPRAALAGLMVGVLVLVVHVLASPVMGTSEFLTLTPLAFVSVAAALVAPIWGALVRAVI
jgi:hypothetical protein